jgi:hypothetical protein
MKKLKREREKERERERERERVRESERKMSQKGGREATHSTDTLLPPVSACVLAVRSKTCLE